MKKEILKLILYLLAAGIFFGCSSLSKQGEEIDFTQAPFDPESNRLVVGETGISLPEGWRFAISEDMDHYLEFSDPDSVYSGGLEYTALGFPISSEDFQKQFIKEFLEKKNIQAVYPLQKQEKTLKILDYREPEKDTGSLISFIPDTEGCTIVEMLYPINQGTAALSLFSGIILSIEKEERFFCRRSIKNIIKFFSTNDIWTWCGDLPQGSLFTGYFPGDEGMYDSMITVWEDAGDTPVPSFWDNTKAGEAFVFELCINNRIITTEGLEYQDDNKTCALYRINENFGSYFIFISVAPQDEAPLVRHLHLLQGVREFFLDCLTLI